MKFGIFTNPKRPKIPQDKIFKLIQLAGLTYSAKDPDIAIVVGGDGTFGYYGRILSIPMLFVGVNDPELLGSKARLAEIFFNNLDKVLRDINLGKYIVEEKKMFSVNFGKNNSTGAHDVLTDIYLERGAFSGCIRYTVSISCNGLSNNIYRNAYDNHDFFVDENYIIEHAIGNGVIISSSFGSKGYYSYPQRLKLIGDSGSLGKIESFADNKLGICHIIPTFLVRQTNKKKEPTPSEFINYVVPWQSTIKISLFREAKVRLYGTTDVPSGIPIKINDEIKIGPSRKAAKIIRLQDRTR
ncbi:MAG TPA: hypothetical protein VI278_13505 [Nitrososphaeraceae archaeon]